MMSRIQVWRLVHSGQLSLTTSGPETTWDSAWSWGGCEQEARRISESRSFFIFAGKATSIAEVPRLAKGAAQSRRWSRQRQGVVGATFQHSVSQSRGRLKTSRLMVDDFFPPLLRGFVYTFSGTTKGRRYSRRSRATGFRIAMEALVGGVEHHLPARSISNVAQMTHGCG